MQPVLFHLPLGLPVHAYGAFLCLSVILGRLLAVRLARRAGMDGALMERCCVVTLVCALAGARLLDVVAGPGKYDGLLDVLAWWRGGVVAYGGFLGGLVGSALFCRRHGVRLLAWADCAAPSLCLGLLLTRVGCFLGGCDFGQPFDGPWAVRFPAGSPAFEEHARLGILPRDASASLPVHPTQLYEAAAGLGLLATVGLTRARSKFPGQAFLALVAGYAVLRYLIELLRGDPGRGVVFSLSTSQLVAVLSFLVAALALAGRRRLANGGSSLA
jgi:phosphatidylglycerol:prolipoprotein diacylglycerol transferase